MSNDSGKGLQVSFGDGNHLPVDVEEQTAPKSEMQHAAKEIFLSCDKDNVNEVLVSDLIEYIQPYMSQNETELLKLRRALDPNNLNPLVDSETFYTEMNLWVHNFKSGPVNNSDNREAYMLPFAQSSPKNICDKEYRDSNLLNMSCSFTTFNNTDVIDPTVYLEKIKELEHDKRKLAEDLRHMQVQLTTSEEQMDLLQLDKERLSKKLILEQQSNEQFLRTEKDKDDTLETSITTSRHISELEKQLAAAEKEISLLHQTISNLEDDNKMIHYQNEEIFKRESETKKLINDLKAEILDKETIILSLDKVVSELQVELREQKKNVEHYENTVTNLKLEKKSIEAKFQEHILSSESITALKKSQSGTSTYVMSPLTVNNNFNTPGLLSRLKNRITSLNSSDISSSASKKKSVDSDDSPVFFAHKRLSDFKEEQKSSTPVTNLVDSTPPSAVRKIPHLLPKANKQMVTQKHSPKKNTFSYCRFVGDLSDDGEDMAFDEPPSHGLRQPHATFLKFESSNEFSPEAQSLPSLYVVERTEQHVKPLISNFDLSGDEVFISLEHINSSANYPLNVELAQANKNSLKEDFIELKSLNEKYKDEIEQLKNEIDKLRSDFKNSKIKLMDSVKCLCCEGSLKCDSNLQIKLKDLESDNNLKYIKIVDLMEEKEGLISKFNEDRATLNEDISKMKMLVTALEIDKDHLKKDLEDKQQHLDEIIHKLEVMKDNYDTLKQKLEQASEQEKKPDYKDLLSQHTELTIELDSAYQYVTQLKSENITLKKKTKKLNEENKKMNTDILVCHQDQEKLKVQLEKLKSHLNLVLEVKSESNKVFEELQKENQTIETKEYKDQYANKVESFIKEINELKVTNANLAQSLIEKNNNLTDLQEVINSQSAKLELETVEKSQILFKADEKKKEIERLVRENNNRQMELNDSRNENENLRRDLGLLEELKKVNQERVESLMEANNKVLMEYKMLFDEKKLLEVDNQQLTIKNQEIVNMQKKLMDLQEKYEFLISEYEAKDRLIQEIQQSDETGSSTANSQDSMESFVTDKSQDRELLICQKCKKLEDKITKAHSKISQLESNKRNYQVISHRKLQIQIEKLENKIEQYEYMLKMKEEQIDNYQLENSKLQKDFNNNSKIWKKEKEELLQFQTALEDKFQTLLKDFQKFQADSRENLKIHVTEKNDLFAKKSVLLTKFNKLQEEHQKLQTQLNEVIKDKIAVKKESISLKQKLKTITEFKDNCLKSSKAEIVQLKIQIEDLSSEKIDFERKLERLRQYIKSESRKEQQLKNSLHDLETIKEENLNLNSALEEANTLSINSTKKFKHSLDLICKENVSLKETVSQLESGNIALESSLKNSEQELQELQVKQDLIERDLRNKLNVCQEELANVKIQVCSSEEMLNSFTSYIKNVKENLKENRQRLSKSLGEAVAVWRLKLENKLEYEIVLEAIDKSKDQATSESLPGYLDEEVVKLKHYVQITSLFLDILNSTKTSNRNVEVQVSFAKPREIQKCLRTSSATYVAGNQLAVTNSPDSGGLHVISQSSSFDNVKPDDACPSSSRITSDQPGDFQDANSELVYSNDTDVQLAEGEQETEPNLRTSSGFKIVKSDTPIKEVFCKFSFWTVFILCVFTMIGFIIYKVRMDYKRFDGSLNDFLNAYYKLEHTAPPPI